MLQWLQGKINSSKTIEMMNETYWVNPAGGEDDDEEEENQQQEIQQYNNCL